MSLSNGIKILQTMASDLNIKQLQDVKTMVKDNVECPFIRVGTDYFKVIIKEDRFGIRRTQLKHWKREEIRLDHGLKYVKKIPQYDDFIIQPSNLNYKPIVNSCYNLYTPFQHKPEQGPWTWTMRLMQHVFGDQLSSGMKYMQTLFLEPKRFLPILVLVSKERGTGKTTFINWLSMLFGGNVALLGAQDLAGDFNFFYATKNIICVEETLIERQLTIEKLKSLSTAKSVTVNQKFTAQFRVPFYGKFILTSNNERRFAKIDQEEVRFFIRKLSTPQHKNHNIENDLLAEIPAFLHHLTTLPPVDYSISRDGFLPEELNNDNLRDVKYESRSSLFKDLHEYFTDFFSNHETVDEIFGTPAELKSYWFGNNGRVDPSYIRYVLKNEFELETEELMRYNPITDFENPYVKKVGRPFKITKDFCNKIDNCNKT